MVINGWTIYAHQMQPVTFKSQRGQCAKLRASKGQHKQFNELFKPIFDSYPNLPRISFSMYRLSTNPRTQYIRAIQQICAQLSLQIVNAGFKTWTKADDHAPQPSLEIS